MNRIKNLDDLNTQIAFLKEKSSLQEQIIKNDVETLTRYVKYPFEFVETLLNKTNQSVIKRVWEFVKSRFVKENEQNTSN